MRSHDLKNERSNSVLSLAKGKMKTRKLHEYTEMNAKLTYKQKKKEKSLDLAFGCSTELILD